MTAPANQRISVMIPVHNGERHLARTLASLLAQTDADFEVLGIDDASTDGSAAILRQQAALDPRLRVITTPTNLGSAPKSLNHALPQMTGAYFAYASQDDMFSSDWLAQMRARALETGADAVIPEVVMFHEAAASPDRTLVGVAGDASLVISGREACERSLDWSIPGNALWNAGIVREFGFDDAAVNGDEYSVRRFFLACHKVAFSGGRFLYRQDNPNAITKRVNAATFDWPLTHLRVAELLQEQGFAPELVQREVGRAIAWMYGLKKKLRTQRPSWGAEEVARAEAAIARFEARLPAGAASAGTGGAARHLERWKNSLRKLPKKLGLG